MDGADPSAPLCAPGLPRRKQGHSLRSRLAEYLDSDIVGLANRLAEYDLRDIQAGEEMGFTERAEADTSLLEEDWPVGVPVA